MNRNGTGLPEGEAFNRYQGQQVPPPQTQFSVGTQQGYQGHPNQQPYQQPVAPYGYSQQMPPAKKKMALWKKILIGLGIVILLGGIAGVASGGKSSDPQNDNTTTSVNNTANDETDSVPEDIPAEQTPPQQDEPPTPAEEPAEEPKTLTVGDTATIDGVEVKLSSVILSRGTEFAQPDAGNLYLGLIVDIANNSQKNISISSLMNFEAYCDDYAIQQSITASTAPEWDGLSSLDGEVAIGKRMNGVITYEVPEGFNSFEISFKPNALSSDTAKFTFGREVADASTI